VTDQPIWLLLSNTSPGRGPETYGDFENIYAWTNRVPNAKQISEDNVAIIGDNYAETILRIGRIASIASSEGLAAIDRCPLCRASSQNRRSSDSTSWKCRKCKHEYSEPFKDLVPTIHYRATLSPCTQYSGTSTYADVQKAGSPGNQNAMREVDFSLLPENLQKLIQQLDVTLAQELITAYPAPRIGRTTEPKIGERKAIADRTAQPISQPEARLVEQFKDWLVASGCQRPAAIKFPTGDGGTWAEADLWVPEKNQLIEAKADATRESVRMAIGQVLDYAHLASLLMETKEFPGLKSSQPTILLPMLPTSDLLELIRKLKIALWVKSNQGFQEIR
jgi:ribosomal protein L37AE/L43A